MLKALVVLAVGQFLLGPCTQGYEGPTDIVGMVHWSYIPGVARWLSEGGDPDLVVDGRSLLFSASGPKGHDVLPLLLAAGANPEGAVEADPTTPFLEAARWGNLEVCQLLLAHGADPHARSSTGRTALGLARRCSTAERLVRWLETLPAGPDHRDVPRRETDDR